MRILHISSGARGGAAVAAQRLAAAQSEAGDETLVVDINYVTLSGVNKLDEIKRKCLSGMQQFFTKKEYGVITPYSYPYLKLGIVKNFKPNVIHIHNWYNMVNYSLIKELSKFCPLVFTLHDERLLTGGCHNTLGCILNNNGCQKCPATSFMRQSVESDYLQKANLFKLLPRYAIVAPSDWLAKKATESNLFATAHQLTKIVNIIDSNFESLSTDTKFQNGEEFKILFIAADITVKLKGFQILRKAFEDLAKQSKNIKYNLTAVGAPNDETIVVDSNATIIYKKPMGQAELRELINQSSILVVPSLADNAPNIIAESQLVGTIVVASNVGGIPEMIEDQITGFLTLPNKRDLMNCIFKVQQSPIELLDKIRREALRQALIRYDSERIIEKYMKLYSSLEECKT